jgi:hypothetical protein
VAGNPSPVGATHRSLTAYGLLDTADVIGAGLAITAFGRSVDRLRLSAGSNRTKTPLDVGVLLMSATLSSGTSTLVSG